MKKLTPIIISTRGISYRIDEIIKTAKKEIILITPYLKIASPLFQRLKRADNRGVDITIIYGKTDLKPELKSQLEKLKNCRLLYLDKLHAKIYLNEKEGVLCSMNLYDYSEVNNYELGIQFSKEESSSSLFKSAMEEVQHILDSAELIFEAENAINKSVDDSTVETFLSSGKKIVNYPIEGMTMTANYGFASFEFDLGKLNYKELYNKYGALLISMKEYRVYWSSPRTKICIYQNTNKNLEDTDLKIYKIQGIKSVIKIIQENFRNL